MKRGAKPGRDSILDLGEGVEIRAVDRHLKGGDFFVDLLEVLFRLLDVIAGLHVFGLAQTAVAEAAFAGERLLARSSRSWSWLEES